MHISPLGIVAILRPIEGLLPGDTAYILSYTGEGFYNVWYRNQQLNLQRFWDDPRFGIDTAADARLVQWPGMTWWVRLTNSANKTGWLPLINTCVTMGVCFDESIIEMIPVDTHGF